MSGNGVAISLSKTRQLPTPIRTVPRVGPNALIAAAVGNRASPVYAQPRAAPTSRISPATILVSESSASANPKALCNKRKTRLTAAFSNWEQRDSAGKNSPAQRLIDAFVHDLFNRTFAAAGQPFANPIVNNDGIVNGIAGDGKHSANHSESKL